MKRIILLIVAIVFYIVMVGFHKTGAEIIACAGDGCKETMAWDLYKSSFVEQWEIFDRRHRQKSEWRSISPNCPRPITLLPSKKKCQWEWRFYDKYKKNKIKGWEPFAIDRIHIWLKRQVCEELK